MSTQPPDASQPPPSLFNAILEIVKKLQNEFLLVSIAYLLIVVAVGVYKQPDFVAVHCQDRIGELSAVNSVKYCLVSF